MVVVRRAVAGDAREVVRLRGVMLDAMGRDTEGDTGWRARCERTFLDLLSDGSFATFVVDAPRNGLVGCVTVWIDQRLPGPHFDGRCGYVANVSTDAAWRRRGVGTALLAAAVAWFDERGVRRVDLHATDEGGRLYERVGFRSPGWVSMRRETPDVTPSRGDGR